MVASRDAESGNLQACWEFGMGFMAYSVLAQGYLAGLFRNPDDLPGGDRRRTSPRFQPGNVERDADLRTRIEVLAREKSATAAQIALAWAMAQGPDVIPIPGCKTRVHLEDNIKASDIHLSSDDLASLD